MSSRPRNLFLVEFGGHGRASFQGFAGVAQDGQGRFVIGVVKERRGGQEAGPGACCWAVPGIQGPAPDGDAVTAGTCAVPEPAADTGLDLKVFQQLGLPVGDSGRDQFFASERSCSCSRQRNSLPE
jgi:hypothetical protein